MGNAGSGKSSLAKRLGEELHLPVYHLDRELLYGDFKKHALEERTRRHSKLTEGEDWIIDGNYRDHLPVRIKRATAVIFLNVPRPTAILRLLKRNKANSHIPESVPEEARKKMTFRLLWWTAKYSRVERLKTLKMMQNEFPDTQLIILAPKSVEEWISEIKQRLAL
jgi:adenylate kinase family enzyme